MRKSLRLEKRLFRLDSCDGERKRPSRSVGSLVERPASSSLALKSDMYDTVSPRRLYQII